MDNPDWHELQKGVEELGHGAIEFKYLDSAGVESDMRCEGVRIEDERIIVSLSE